MTAQFHEGQEVEVYYPFSRSNEATWPWCKAKIIARASDAPITRNRQWAVQFRDGTRAVFDTEHIRAARSDLQDGYDDCHQCGRVS